MAEKKLVGMFCGNAFRLQQSRSHRDPANVKVLNETFCGWEGSHASTLSWQAYIIPRFSGSMV